jgi:hypothetical protein
MGEPKPVWLSLIITRYELIPNCKKLVW